MKYIVEYCLDCKFYTPMDDIKRDCFVYEVSATLYAGKCSTKGFQPRN